MITEAQVEDAAARLFEAERERRQIRLLSLDFPQATMDDASRVRLRGTSRTRPRSCGLKA